LQKIFDRIDETAGLYFKIRCHWAHIDTLSIIAGNYQFKPTIPGGLELLEKAVSLGTNLHVSRITQYEIGITI